MATFVHEDLYEFAIELHQLACTTPGGHEDPLAGLSERMAQAAGGHRHDIPGDAMGTGGRSRTR